MLGNPKILHNEAAGHCISASTQRFMCTGAWFSVPQAALACLQYPQVSSGLCTEGQLAAEAGVLSPSCTTKLLLVSLGDRQEDACRKSSL